MSFLLGLTGSIGMGKSTTARLFQDQGCAIWDADAAVHRLYGPGGEAVLPVSALFPEAVEDGQISRSALRDAIRSRPDALTKLEKIVHPLVARDRDLFIAQAEQDIIVLDIPLLFENGTETELDAVAVVSVDPEQQRQRVLDRGTMTEDQFETILNRQMPDAQKRARADYVIHTDTLEHAQQQVHAIVAEIRASLQHA